MWGQLSGGRCPTSCMERLSWQERGSRYLREQTVLDGHGGSAGRMRTIVSGGKCRIQRRAVNMVAIKTIAAV